VVPGRRPELPDSACPTLETASVPGSGWRSHPIRTSPLALAQSAARSQRPMDVRHRRHVNQWSSRGCFRAPSWRSTAKLRALRGDRTTPSRIRWPRLPAVPVRSRLSFSDSRTRRESRVSTWSGWLPQDERCDYRRTSPRCATHERSARPFVRARHHSPDELSGDCPLRTPPFAQLVDNVQSEPARVGAVGPKMRAC